MPERTEVPNEDITDPARISTGSTGLDDILGGGFDSDRLYLYEGRPGTGKTTLALQFLMKGARNCRATIKVREPDNQGERGFRGLCRREGGARPEAQAPATSI
jgi:circadian clock protein KaiC